MNRNMGLLTYEYQISFARSMVDKTPADELIKEEVTFLMSVLPKGTEFLDAVSKQHHTFMMAHTYELTFGHPYFEDGTKLEVDRQLIVWQEGEDRIRQSEMFLGLRYIKPYPVNPMAHLDDVGAPIMIGTGVPEQPASSGLIGYQAYSNSKDGK